MKSFLYLSGDTAPEYLTVITIISEQCPQLFEEAEADFRRNLVDCPDKHIQALSHFHLGLTLYYRGKVRVSSKVRQRTFTP